MANRAGAGAHALSHIWISEDSLVRAFQRFENVSKSQRRYGSHVPGPMEAHRRTAKRRMAIAANSPGVAALFDVNALFSNIWSRTTVEPEKEWKWTAPSIAVGKARKSELGAVILDSGNTITNESITMGTPDKISTPDLLETSRLEFNSLLEVLEAEHVIEADLLAPCLQFLASDRNIREAHNAERLAGVLSARFPTQRALTALGNTMFTMMRLEAATKIEVVQMIAILWKNTACQRRARPILRRIIDGLEVSRARDFVSQLTSSIVNQTYPGRSRAQLKALLNWLNTLQGCTKLANSNSTNEIWGDVYQLVSAKWTPRDLTEHLCKLSPYHLCCVLIPHWPNWAMEHRPSWVDKGGHMLLTLGHHSPLPTNRMPKYLIDDFNAQLAKDGSSSSPFDCFSTLLSAMKRHGVPYSQLYCGLFEIYFHHEGPEVFVPTFLQVAKSNLGLEPPVVLLEVLMARLIAIDTPIAVQLAQKVFQKFPGLSGLASLNLPSALIRHGHVGGVWPQRIFDVLSRHDPEGVKVDAIDKAGQTKVIRLSSAQIQETEQVALLWASSPSLTPRQSWRRVWSCFRFMQDRGVPLSANMLQAMLEGGVLRYLKHDQPVPEEQLRYILSHVVALEGIDAAERLQQSVRAFCAKSPSIRKSPRLPETHTRPAQFRIRPWATQQCPVPQAQIEIWAATRRHPPGVRVRRSKS